MKLLMMLVGVVLMILSVCAGIYVGFWLMFIGGIMDIINEVKAPITEAVPIALGFGKIIFASFVGGLTFWLGAFISGVFFLTGDSMTFRRRRRF